MANKEEVTQQARELIADSLGVALNEVTLDSSFIDDLNADSLDIVELVMELEKRFGIEIPDDEAEKISTVRDAVNYIVDHIPA